VRKYVRVMKMRAQLSVKFEVEGRRGITCCGELQTCEDVCGFC
jgi:hypothetical protein